MATSGSSRLLSSQESRADLCLSAHSSHLTINCLAHLLMLSHLLPVLEKTEQAHPDADIRIVLQASELHRTTFGGPSEAFGGDKFRSVDEFKVRGARTVFERFAKRARD